jgi:hypothetical protein
MYVSSQFSNMFLHNTRAIVTESLLLSERFRKVRYTIAEWIKSYADAYILKFNIQFCISRNLYIVQPLQ